MLCLILIVLFFSRRHYWHGYGYPHAYQPYGGYGYAYAGYPYGAYSYYNPYARMGVGRGGYYRPYGYW